MLDSLNSAGNVGKRVGTFGKFTRELSSCLLVLQGYVQVTGEYFCPRGTTHIHIYTVSFTTFRVPYAVLRYVGGQFWYFLLADLSVGVQTAARAPLCPLFCRKFAGIQWERVLSWRLRPRTKTSRSTGRNRNNDSSLKSFFHSFKLKIKEMRFVFTNTFSSL